MLIRDNDRILITCSEAARRLGTNPKRVARWIEKGELDGFRLEGHRTRRLVDADQVEALRLTLQGHNHQG